VHVRASSDGFVYDTEDWAVFDNGFAAGERASKTVEVSAQPQFVKVVVENLDQKHGVAGLVVTATLAG
jgi:hypothetical protein